jgi:hypothetical protein
MCYPTLEEVSSSPCRFRTIQVWPKDFPDISRRYRRVGTRAHYSGACRLLGGLTISEGDNEDQIRAISAKSFLVGSSKLAHNGRQKLAVCHPQLWAAIAAVVVGIVGVLGIWSGQ